MGPFISWDSSNSLTYCRDPIRTLPVFTPIHLSGFNVELKIEPDNWSTHFTENTNLQAILGKPTKPRWERFAG